MEDEKEFLAKDILHMLYRRYERKKALRFYLKCCKMDMERLRDVHFRLLISLAYDKEIDENMFKGR